MLSSTQGLREATESLQLRNPHLTCGPTTLSRVEVTSMLSLERPPQQKPLLIQEVTKMWPAVSSDCPT